MARRPFTGPLAEPIDVGDDLDPRRWGPDLTDDERAGLIREKTLQLCLAGQAKLPALFAHYEVDLADPHAGNPSPLSWRWISSPALPTRIWYADRRRDKTALKHRCRCHQAPEQKFTGELAKRIKTLPVPPTSYHDWFDDLITQRWRKLPALLRHYGWKGPDNSLGSLTVGELLFFMVAMTTDLVPGFQTGPGAGRPHKHGGAQVLDAVSQEVLLTAVEVIRAGSPTECVDVAQAEEGKKTSVHTMQNLVAQARASRRQGRSAACLGARRPHPGSRI